MPETLRAALGAVLVVLASGSALADDPSPPPNYQGLWWNAPPGSESGWGINLAHQGDTILATWLTYDAAGDAHWLALKAAKSAEGLYTGPLFESRGSSFASASYDPLAYASVTVGSGTLAFRDAANGTFSIVYGPRGLQASKSITRQAFGPLPACTYSSRPDFGWATNYTDQWGAATGNEPAWGIDLAHQGDVLVGAWFTYDQDHSPLWFSVVASRIASGVYGGTLVRSTGPAFDANTFDPGRVTRTAAGTATFTFANGNAATFAYTLDGVSRTQAIARQLLAAPAGTRCRAAASDTIAGLVIDGVLERVLVCADANANGRCDPGEAQALTNAEGRYELAAPSGYAGALAAEVIAGQSRDARAAVDRSYRLASPAREYSPHITPFSTLVRLTGERDLRLAEEMVRNELGLPNRFPINLDAVPADGSLTLAVSRAIVVALKDTAATLDASAPGALARVVAAFPPSLTQLPRLTIATKNAAPVLSKDVYVDAVFTLATPATSSEKALNGKMRGRGNYTWLGDKKPYKVQFTNDAAYAGLTDVIGMKKNRNWVLLADYFDRTLVRNKLAQTLANSSLFADGLKWSPSGQHVEVTLNGDYIGVYLLSEDIRIDAARLPIHSMSATPAAGDIEGGYLVEVDFPLDCYNDGAINLQVVTPMGVHFCIKTPDEGAITPAQQRYIGAYLEAAERAIHDAGDLSRTNLLSYADWYLLNELFRNYDAPFYSSDYMWKDTASAANPADRVLNMGPIWDFDMSTGNVPFDRNWETQGCWVSRTVRDQPNWFARLLELPDLLDLTLARWKDKRPGLERLIDSSIAAFTRRLEGAQQRNFARWPVLEGTRLLTDHTIFSSYGEHVGFLKGYLKERMNWLDLAYASREDFAAVCR